MITDVDQLAIEYDVFIKIYEIMKLYFQENFAK